ncbi:MAG: leucine-rich repeat protein [Dysgonamonadaceae bacterium]|nr:leucine-rich repeat protein [Dysgonamonadaceae bacterium]
MKKICTVLLACLMTAGAVPAFADESGSCGTSLTWTYTSSNHRLTISGTGTMSNYFSYRDSRPPWYSYHEEIQTIAINNGVTSIGNYAFAECTNLQGFIDVNSSSTTVNNTTVTSIGDYAFYNCDHLMNTLDLDYLFSGLQTIGERAFAECDGLTRFQHGSALTTIGVSAFQNCPNMTSAVIGSSVTFIDNDAFANNTALKTVTFEDGSTTLQFGDHIDENYFSNNSIETLYLGRKIRCGANGESSYDPDSPFDGIISLQTVTIGSPVTAIGSNLFKGCIRLASVTLPASGNLVTIGGNAFNGCESLSSLNCIPNTVTAIGNYAFKGTAIPSITIPNSVTSIGYDAFVGNTALKTVTFADGSTTLQFGNQIDENYFSNNSIETLYLGRKISFHSNSIPFDGIITLKTLTVGSNVTEINASLFSGCVNLQSITNKVAVPQTINANVFTGVNKQTCLLAVPAGSLSAYQTAAVWKDFYAIQGITGDCTGTGNVSANPVSLGSAVVLEYLAGNTAKIAALPKAGSVFVSWADGNTDNPRTVSLCNTNFVAKFASCDGPQNTEAGVTIDGITWATSNIAAPGVFSAAPESAGMFYQWNRKIGWSATDPLVNSNGGTAWSASNPTGFSWAATNNPCPDGWRIPFREDYNSLIKSGSKWTDNYNGSGVAGRIFGAAPNQIFLPAAGFRGNAKGELDGTGWLGYYWTSTTQGNDDKAYNLYLVSGDAHTRDYHLRTHGYSLRCVKSNTTGVNHVAAVNAIQIYPNPVKDVLFINSDTPVENVEIYDMSGKQIVNSKLSDGKSLNVSHLTAGIYLVKAGNYTAKFVKE